LPGKGWNQHAKFLLLLPSFAANDAPTTCGCSALLAIEAMQRVGLASSD
jgi:hypothetical protein